MYSDSQKTAFAKDAKAKAERDKELREKNQERMKQLRIESKPQDVDYKQPSLG